MFLGQQIYIRMISGGSYDSEDWRNEYNIFDEYVSIKVEEKKKYIECIVNNHAQS